MSSAPVPSTIATARALRTEPVDVVATASQAAQLARPPLLVLEPLAAVLDAHGIGRGPIDARFIGDGHSNVTCLLVRGDETVVLRRPPRPPLPPRTHDVLREARVLGALRPAGVPVPEVLLTCDDDAVLGVPFYVMEYLEGRVLTDRTPPALGTPGDRWRLGTALVDTLAALHAVDWRGAGLEGFGRPEGYLDRQLRTFSTLWASSRTRDVPLVDELEAWLRAHRPAGPEAAATVVHGDFRIGNVMVASTPPVRLLAVMDWEMATLGDPLADLGYLTATYAQRGAPLHVMSELSAVTRERGFCDRGDLVRRYALRTGRDVSGLGWYQVLALWKSCVFLEGSYRRWRDGSTDDAWFGTLGDRVPELARAASALAAGVAAAPGTPS